MHIYTFAPGSDHDTGCTRPAGSVKRKWSHSFEVCGQVLVARARQVHWHVGKGTIIWTNQFDLETKCTSEDFQSKSKGKKNPKHQ